MRRNSSWPRLVRSRLVCVLALDAALVAEALVAAAMSISSFLSSLREVLVFSAVD